MSVLPAVAFLLVTATGVGAVLAVVLLATRVRPGGNAQRSGGTGTAPDGGWRVAGWRFGGVLAGIVAALLIGRSGDLGRGVLLAAPLFGLCVLVGVVLGEVAAARPRGGTRRAAVEVRRVRDYLPPWLSRAVGVAGAMLAALVAATTAAGSADDLGRAGRALARDCGDYAQAAGPWPGSYYTGPLAVVVLAGLLLAGVALRRVVGRPRPVDPAGDLVRDDAVRRRAAGAVVGACGLLVTIPLVGVSVVTANVLHRMDCPPGWWAPAGWLLLALVPVWLVVAAGCLAAILAPGGHRRPADAGTAAPHATR